MTLNSMDELDSDQIKIYCALHFDGYKFLEGKKIS